MKKYAMIGVCRIKLDDGRWIYPGQPPFSAQISERQEQFFVGIGAIRVIEPPKQLDSTPKEGG